MSFVFGSTIKNYFDLRYEIIRNLEEPGGVVHLGVYVDTHNLATIGAGFLVSANAEAILVGMGFSASVASSAAKKIVAATNHVTFSSDSAAQSAVNAALASALSGAGNSATFQYKNSDQVRNTFSAIAKQYEGMVDSWTPPGVTIPNGRERLALLSLAYNNMLGIKINGKYKSPLLRDAIAARNRAEAWFQIRYDSNGGDSPDRGTAKRRFYESSLLGLYADPKNATLEEAKRAVSRVKCNV